MKCQALGAVKGQVTLLADDGRLLEHVVIRTRIRLVSVAGPASSAFARVVGCIIMVIATVALVAPIALVNEPSDGGTPLVMIVRLEKDDFTFSVRSTEYQKKGMVTAEDLQLIGRVQGGQVLLEFVQLWQTTGAFWDACISVKLLSVDALATHSLAKSFPVAAGHVVTVVAMTPGLHGHNGAGAAQLIFVFDLYD